MCVGPVGRRLYLATRSVGPTTGGGMRGVARIGVVLALFVLLAGCQRTAPVPTPTPTVSAPTAAPSATVAALPATPASPGATPVATSASPAAAGDFCAFA